MWGGAVVRNCCLPAFALLRNFFITGPSQLPHHSCLHCCCCCCQVGDRVTAGDIYGIVKENTLMDHKVSSMVQQFAQ